MATTRMKQASPQTLHRLGNRPLVAHHKNVHDTVESWNWNMNIFEIYDEIREWHEHDIKNVLTYAYHFFDQDQPINELHAHLIGWSVNENEES